MFTRRVSQLRFVYHLYLSTRETTAPGQGVARKAVAGGGYENPSSFGSLREPRRVNKCVPLTFRCSAPRRIEGAYETTISSQRYGMPCSINAKPVCVPAPVLNRPCPQDCCTSTSSTTSSHAPKQHQPGQVCPRRRCNVRHRSRPCTRHP